MLDQPTALHLARRLSFGPGPGEIERVASAGFDGYIEGQLNADPSKLPEQIQAQLRSLPSFGLDTTTLYRKYWFKALAQMTPGQKVPHEQKKLLKKITNEVGPEARMARLIRAISSPHRLHEALVDFWFNHFNVFDNKKFVRVWVGAYEAEAVRPYVLGKFRDLLLATAKHPAMLVYLDNWQNVAPGTHGNGKKAAAGINENYAREVMELHTLGVDGGYTQSDVTALAHILTGWTVGRQFGAAGGMDGSDDDLRASLGGFAFVPRRHDDAPQTVLGRKFGNGGMKDGEAALLMLAEHPSTARHISTQLAQYFVADRPSAQLIADMTSVFRKTDGDLKAVVRTMLTSKDFRDPANFGAKFKTPYQYIISVARVARLDPMNAAPLAEELKVLGQPIYGCLSPDGYACTETAWLDPDAMMRRISFAIKFGTGAYMQPHLARAGYGSMKKPVQLELPAGNAPLNADRLLAVLGPELSSKTRSAVTAAKSTERAGLILGSPEFMRC
ncbi:MAG TPA: DUF1800 domain-containing protein [Rhizomicrobium sp.]|jgi:uncharacterized protein (DUF1800 family)|nr:DUF1800 domain-containing protein [Rhizomicrobium sp.]